MVNSSGHAEIGIFDVVTITSALRSDNAYVL